MIRRFVVIYDVILEEFDSLPELPELRKTSHYVAPCTFSRYILDFSMNLIWSIISKHAHLIFKIMWKDNSE